MGKWVASRWPTSRLKVTIVGISMRRCKRGVFVGFKTFHMCNAGELCESVNRPVRPETAPSGVVDRSPVVSDAVYVV